jgi:hypothetical protein
MKAVRRGPGRVAEDGATDLEKVTVSLPASIVRRAKRLGRGNTSKGLRALFERLDRYESDFDQRFEQAEAREERTGRNDEAEGFI